MLIPCKYINHDPSHYPAGELKTCAPLMPDVKYFERKVLLLGSATKVQFCGRGKGVIDGIFGCYGELPCHQPATLEGL